LPKIRFANLPRPVWEHILARVAERQISFEDLSRLQDWVNSGPNAPEGDWYKDFRSFLLCGTGEFRSGSAAINPPLCKLKLAAEGLPRGLSSHFR